jgi:hypothetical protein
MEALNKKASAVASKMSRQRGAQFRDGRFDILHAQRKAAMPRRFRRLMLSISSSAQCWARLRRQLFYAAILPPATSTMAATMPFAPSGPAASNAAATEMTAADAAKLQQALAAYDQGRSKEAPPLLEELLTCHPPTSTSTRPSGSSTPNPATFPRKSWHRLSQARSAPQGAPRTRGRHLRRHGPPASACRKTGQRQGPHTAAVNHRCRTKTLRRLLSARRARPGGDPLAGQHSAARRAIALRPDLAEAHYRLAQLLTPRPPRRCRPRNPAPAAIR